MFPTNSRTLFVVVVSGLFGPTLADFLSCPSDGGPCLIAILLIVPLLVAVVAVLAWLCLWHFCPRCAGRKVDTASQSNSDDTRSDNSAEASPLQVVVCSRSLRRSSFNEARWKRARTPRVPYDGIRDFQYDPYLGIYIDVNYVSYLKRMEREAADLALRSSTVPEGNHTEMITSNPNISGSSDSSRSTQSVDGTESGAETTTPLDEAAAGGTEVTTRFDEWAGNGSEINAVLEEYEGSETEGLSWDYTFSSAPEGEDQLDLPLARPSPCEKSSSRPKSFTPTLGSIGEELEEGCSDIEVPRPSRPLSLVSVSNRTFQPMTDLTVIRYFV